LLFTTEKVGDTMKAAIDPRQAKEWFGGNPPDLTVDRTSRVLPLVKAPGADYLYTYLRTYYPDDTKATGWNNLAFPERWYASRAVGTAGKRKRRVSNTVEEHGHEVHVFKGWERTAPGTMTPAQFDQAMGDLVSYLQWMGEPAAEHTCARGCLGVVVLVCDDRCSPGV